MTETLFTQFAALLAAALLIPAFVFLAHGINHKKMAFWRVAAAAYLFIFAGSSVAALRDVLPDMAAISVGNSLIGIGYFLCLKSVRMVRSEHRHTWIDMFLTAVFFVSLTSVLIWANTYQLRVVVLSALIASSSFCVVVLAMHSKSRTSSLGDIALVVFGVGNTLIPTARALSAIFDERLTLLNFAVWDQVFFIWSIAAVFCFAIGLFLNGTALISKATELSLETERLLTAELKSALEGQRNLQKLLLHEVKRPINAILTSVQASRSGDQGLTKIAAQKLETLAQEAHRYLDGISQYDEIGALIDTPDLSKLKIANIAADTRNKWFIAVAVAEPCDKLEILADPLLIDIAISNLIENAQKFGSTSAAIRLCISAKNGVVAFEVTDDGAGIPKEEQENVFGQFYKLGDSSRNATKGCGLGLYVVKQIAQAHGGYAKVVSQSPSTLCFTVSRIKGKYL